MKHKVMATLSVLLAVTISVAVSGCGRSSQHVQARVAREAARSINFTENAEIDNIKKRLELTASPSLVGYVVLLNGTGQPILYTAIKGKITSGSKKLTDGGVTGTLSDEGTHGSSNPYIYFWSTSGVYHQWSGDYLYSDKPIRLSVQALVVNVTE